MFLQCNVPTCDRLAPDSKIVDLTITNRDGSIVDVSNVGNAASGSSKGILIEIPRTNDTGAGLPVRIKN